MIRQMNSFVRQTERFVAVALTVAVSSGIAIAADSGKTVVEVGPALYHPTLPSKAAPKASDLALSAQRLPASARHDLGELSTSERDRLNAPDPRGGTGARAKRVKNGITRDLSSEVGFTGLSAGLPSGGYAPFSGGLLEKLADGTLVWTAEFSSSGAGAVRLYVSQARLPRGSRVYVYGDDGEIKGPYDFTAGTRPEGFWTNAIYSSSISIEVRIPSSAPSDLAAATLRVSGVVHIVKAGTPTLQPKDDSCFVDATCVSVADWPNINEAGLAVAQLNFVDQGSSYLCSGGLMNTVSGPTAPYLLTANHCFGFLSDGHTFDQPAATSLEAVWQYKTETCNGPIPDESQFPSTLGSTMLATGTHPGASDYTFVQLSEDPPDNSLALGWTTADVRNAAGLVLYRLSYPLNANMIDVTPQIFTREQVILVSGNEACSDSPTSIYIYEQDIEGGTGGGSSGSPLMLADMRVVGQEFGACGTNTNDDCDNVNNSSVDGAFSATFPAVQQWLAPSSFGACVADANSLCLDNNRFRVTALWTKSDNTSGSGTAVPLTGNSGYFWFFSDTNIELVVKALDGCSVNSNFWVFAAGLTNVNVTMIVEDTVTGRSQTYMNPQGVAYQPLQDTAAFPCP
jgi:hypothetical protein